MPADERSPNFKLPILQFVSKLKCIRGDKIFSHIPASKENTFRESRTQDMNERPKSLPGTVVESLQFRRVIRVHRKVLFCESKKKH